MITQLKNSKSNEKKTQIATKLKKSNKQKSKVQKRQNSET